MPKRKKKQKQINKIEDRKTMKKLNETSSPLEKTLDKKFLDLTQKHNL